VLCHIGFFTGYEDLFLLSSLEIGFSNIFEKEGLTQL